MHRRVVLQPRFSFNVKGGRCEECAGEGYVTTRLQFMADVETPCLHIQGGPLQRRDARSALPRQDDCRVEL